VLRNSFLLAILSAEKSLRIQSPYFVPDEAILEGLLTQCLAGVDVQFMMTGVPDKKIAWNAAFSYMDELVDAGGKMLHYDAGFFHPKTMTIDGEVAVIGTTNFDIRSFVLHDELSIFFFSPEVAAEQNAVFDRDLVACHPILPEFYRSFGAPRRFGNALARLWSRLL
ncbi:MAG TPA: phospholipase D-like domain-containing protein, partial [Coriobacteriia bacterium]|nr:phospholipase D-like domain-containing protein [Coriobacteriia bacterium]